MDETELLFIGDFSKSAREAVKEMMCAVPQQSSCDHVWCAGEVKKWSGNPGNFFFLFREISGKVLGILGTSNSKEGQKTEKQYLRSRGVSREMEIQLRTEFMTWTI